MLCRHAPVSPGRQPLQAWPEGAQSSVAFAMNDRGSETKTSESSYGKSL